MQKTSSIFLELFQIWISIWIISVKPLNSWVWLKSSSKICTRIIFERFFTSKTPFILNYLHSFSTTREGKSSNQGFNHQSFVGSGGYGGVLVGSLKTRSRLTILPQWKPGEWEEANEISSQPTDNDVAQVPKEKVDPTEVFTESDGQLETSYRFRRSFPHFLMISFRRMRFSVRENHLFQRKLIVKCNANIGEAYWQTSEASIDIIGKPSITLPSRSNSYAGNGTQRY